MVSLRTLLVISLLLIADGFEAKRLLNTLYRRQANRISIRSGVSSITGNGYTKGENSSYSFSNSQSASCVGTQCRYDSKRCNGNYCSTENKHFTVQDKRDLTTHPLHFHQFLQYKRGRGANHDGTVDATRYQTDTSDSRYQQDSINSKNEERFDNLKNQQGNSNVVNQQGSTNSLNQQGTNISRHINGSTNSGTQQRTNNSRYQQGIRSSRNLKGTTNSWSQQGTHKSRYQQVINNSKYQQGTNNSRHQQGQNNSKYKQGTNNSRYQQGSIFSWNQQGTNSSLYQLRTNNSRYQQDTNNSRSQQGTYDSRYQQSTNNSRSQQGTTISWNQQGTKNSKYQQGPNNSTYQQGSTNSRNQQGTMNSRYQQGTTNSRYQQGNGESRNQKGGQNSRFQLNTPHNSYWTTSPCPDGGCYETVSKQEPQKAYVHNYTALCQNPNTERSRYPVNGVCFGYYECHEKIANYRQCKQTCGFNPWKMECVPDSSCKTACPASIDIDPSNPDGFIMGGVPKTCPPKTYFDFRICTCDHKRNQPTNA